MSHPNHSRVAISFDPYLRRRDIDVNIVEASDLTDPVWQDAHIQIIWKGETIETPMQLIVND